MDEQELFGLVAVAQEQQKAVKSAIDGLTAERVALARERAALGTVVADSVKQSLRGASEVATKSLREAANPIFSKLDSAVRAATEVEGYMRAAGAWFAWKWVAMAAGGTAGVCLIAYLALAWQLHEVSSLRTEKAALAAEVTQMRANVSALKRRGGNIVMTTCGGRLCIEASSNQGTEQDGSPIPMGGWTAHGGRVQLVIPRGY